MALHSIKKGLTLPITGAPVPTIDAGKSVRRVAVMAEDFVGMKPTFQVKEGDTVQRGQLLFEDKKTPGVVHTAPGAGTVVAIHRGARRALQSVVIELNDAERNGEADQVTFSAYTGADLASLNRDAIEALLLESGLWTALRTRPFSRQPAPGSQPVAIFVNAMDTEPLAPPMDLMVKGREDDLNAGLAVLAKLTEGTTYFCKAADSKISPSDTSGVQVETFEGPHPSGLAGTHIHLLEGVSNQKIVWSIGLQDVLAVGALFRTGSLDVTRIIALAGPGVAKPRLLKTRLGASIDELVEGELNEGEARVIAGAVISGRTAMGETLGYLGHYHQQISVVMEDHEQEFLGWMMPGGNKYSISNLFAAKLARGKQFAIGTSTYGSPRAMVPFGYFEKVMPLDILPTFLLRALIMQDIVEAEKLGALELDEEDLALCTFVCPGKTEYGPLLRENLTIIEKEG